MSELIWLLKCGFCVWVAWRAVLMLGIANPLMGIFLSIGFMLGAPLGLDLLIETCGGNGDAYGVWEMLANLRFGAPLAFALIGAFLWSGIETLMGH